MPQSNLIQNAFNSGELSPLALSRSDTAPFKHGLAKCRNMVPTPIGPASKRMGTRFVAPVADESQDSRLVNFSYSNVQSYMLEFADGQIRFFTPSGEGGWVIPAPINFTGVRVDTTANTIGFETPHYLQEGAGPFRLATDDTLPDPLAIDTDYYVVLAAVGAGAASLGLSLTPGGAAVSLTDTGTATGSDVHTILAESSVIQAVDAPYSVEEVWELDFVPTGDILYITHENHPPHQLERRTSTGFILREMFIIDGPYERINTNQSMTMDPTASPALTQSRPHDFAPADVSLNTETPANTITIPFHGYSDGEGPIELNSTGTVPAGTTADTSYFIQKTNEHQFQLNLLPDDATPLVITDRGTGTHVISGTSQDALLMLGDFFNTDSPSKDLNRRWRYQDDFDTNGQPQWAWGIIHSVTDARNAFIEVHRAYGALTADAEYIFRMGAFYSGNYPRFVTIHEQRLWFASTPGLPTTLWGSQIGDFSNFAPDEGVEEYDDLARVITASSAINYTLGAGQVDRFSWIAAVRQLIIGTTGAIWPVQATSLLDAISQANINSRPSATVGSALVKPVQVSDEIIYSSASQHKVLAIGFDFERDAFVPQNLSILASHFTEVPITQMAYAEEPDSVIWCTREDGLLMGITYDRTQKVLGWHAHTLGGTDSEVRSVAVITDDNKSYDQLWMVAKRTINGQTRRYIEFTEEPFYTNSKLEDAAYLDSSLAAYDGVPITQISGLDHLEAEDVYALADGSWVGNLKVVGGTITLPSPASKVRVGLNYTAYIKTLPVESVNVPGGSLRDRTKRIVESHLHLHRTNYAKIGKELDSMVQVKLRRIGDTMEDPVPLRTQHVNLMTAHGLGIDESFYVSSDKPVPLDLTGMTGRVEWGVR